MSFKQFFRFMVLLTVLAYVYMSVGLAWDLQDLMRVFFSERPRFSEHTRPQHQIPPASSQEDQRGRAQELRPDINVPPTADDSASDKDNSADKASFEGLISGLENIAGVVGNKNTLEQLPTQAIRPQDSANKVRWIPPPPGFLTADTFNYLIYREAQPVTANIRTVLDTIHGNLMFDLIPFTVVVQPNKILVILFSNKNTYHQFTHLPSWSGASSDLKADTMYVVEGTSFYALSVHELTHLYFDGYFLPTISPLWLSEGMAVYMQIYASKQKPSWIEHGLQRILNGELIPFEEMTTVEDLDSYSTEQAELWYTQAYSVVDYLLNNRSRDEFYKFCNELKAGTPLYQALYRAYGMPFNKVSVLQNVWLHDLHKAYKEGRLLQVPPTGTVVRQMPPADGMTPQRTTTVVQTRTVVRTTPAQNTSSQSTASTAKTTAKKPVAQKTKINKLKKITFPGYMGGS